LPNNNTNLIFYNVTKEVNYLSSINILSFNQPINKIISVNDIFNDQATVKLY